MSSELKCAARFQPGAASSTSALSQPTRTPNQRRAASHVTSKPAAPTVATQSRACHSPMPKNLNASAVIQICNGGFSK